MFPGFSPPAQHPCSSSCMAKTSPSPREQRSQPLSTAMCLLSWRSSSRRYLFLQPFRPGHQPNRPRSNSRLFRQELTLNWAAVIAGSTPSSEAIAPGEHTIKITKSGYKPWERKMKTTVGHITVAAQLEQDAAPSATSTTVPQPSSPK